MLCIVCVCVWLLDDDVNVFFICHYVNKFSPHFNFNLTNGKELLGCGGGCWVVSCDLDCDERKDFPNGFHFLFINFQIPFFF